MNNPCTSHSTSKTSASDTSDDGPSSPVPGGFQSISSVDLLGERGELKIQHNGELYSLRRTRQGKLILTK